MSPENKQQQQIDTEYDFQSPLNPFTSSSKMKKTLFGSIQIDQRFASTQKGPFFQA